MKGSEAAEHFLANYFLFNFFFSISGITALEAVHLGIEKNERERKKRKIENKRFDPESNTTNLSVDTFKHHDY